MKDLTLTLIGGALDLDFVEHVGGGTQPQRDAVLDFFNIGGSGCCDAASQSRWL